MPVTTRSKTHLLQTTGLGLPQVCWVCSLVSSSTTLISAESMTTNLSRLPLPLVSNLRPSELVHQDFSTNDMVSNCFDHSSLVVSSDISKFQTFQPGESSSKASISNFPSSVSNYNCHNSLDFKNSTMESDCKDEAAMIVSSEPID